ncbi:hypothetical protein BBJ28_00018181, partial [Nothophytophthora sp. Chile5]
MAEDAAPATNGGDAPAPAQQSVLERLWPMIRMLLMWYAFTSVMEIVMPNRHHQPPKASSVQDPSASVASAGDHVASPTNAPVSIQRLENAFRKGDPINLRVYVSPDEHFVFADAADAATVENEQEQLRWFEDALAYDSTPNAAREDGVWTQQMNISVDEYLLNNGSLYAHVFLTKDGYSPNPADSTYDSMGSIYRTLELTAFRPPPKIVKKRSLLGSNTQENEAAQAEEEAKQVIDGDADTYISMWKPTFSVNVILDHTTYSLRQPPPPFVSTEMNVDHDAGL